MLAATAMPSPTMASPIPLPRTRTAPWLIPAQSGRPAADALSARSASRSAPAGFASTTIAAPSAAASTTRRAEGGHARRGRLGRALGDPRRARGIRKHEDRRAVGSVQHDAARGREVRRRDRDHGLELRALARLLARCARGKLLDLQENDAGYVRAVHGPPACRLGRPLNRHNIRVEFTPLRSVASLPNRSPTTAGSGSAKSNGGRTGNGGGASLFLVGG